MIENSALIFEDMSVVFINFKNFNLFRFLGSHDLWLHFRPHKVYFFERSMKFYIKSSPKTLKLVNFYMEVKKEPKIRMAATRRNLFLRSKMKTNPS
jgi:hypothetical protein